jgi:hypothetical protein
MTPPEEEGLCELFRFLWLSHYSESASTTAERSDEAKHILRSMMDNKDPVYGDGFRKVLASYKTASIPLIDFMRLVHLKKRVP